MSFDKYLNRPKHRPDITIPCEFCGKVFRQNRHWQRFCSYQCQQRGYSWTHIRVPREELEQHQEGTGGTQETT